MTCPSSLLVEAAVATEPVCGSICACTLVPPLSELTLSFSGFLAYIEEMQQQTDEKTLGGMWDLIMYSAGVSGSCWTLGG